MGKHVTFDYSLADKFIREDEVELMMASIHAARETLESKAGQEMISLAGLICRKIMTRLSLSGFRQQRKRFSQIQMYWS